jgi:cyclomaltodextrinase
MTVPDWVSDAIIYQIFPDRFANGDTKNDPPNVQPWGTTPNSWGFQGGDLKGVLDRFDYLLDLGVNTIYFNPIFHATSNHRYNTTDYFKIDPKLGSLEDFWSLLTHAHRHQVRVILDGVFNHCGRGFFAFQDVLENQQHSPYVDWYHFHRFPIQAYGAGNARDYEAWWNLKGLPKFNTNNSAVREFLLSVARYWIEQGVDGWRLDVPNEINDDSFWAEFRQIVKQANPQAYLVGEIWEADPRWVGDGHFDGLMNYPFRDELINFIVTATTTASEFGKGIEALLNTYPSEHNFAHLLPLSTHDTQRQLTVCGGDVELVRLMNLIQFCYPGAPNIYYGEEIGMEGGEDPDCRGAFPWDESKWDNELRSYLKKLIQMRQQYLPLRKGQFVRLMEDDEGSVVAFARILGDERITIIINASERRFHRPLKTSELSLQAEGILLDVLGGSRHIAQEGTLEIDLSPFEGMVLVNAG